VRALQESLSRKFSLGADTIFDDTLTKLLSPLKTRLLVMIVTVLQN
jgi:hypothetical protein